MRTHADDEGVNAPGRGLLLLLLRWWRRVGDGGVGKEQVEQAGGVEEGVHVDVAAMQWTGKGRGNVSGRADERTSDLTINPALTHRVMKERRITTALRSSLSLER